MNHLQLAPSTENLSSGRETRTLRSIRTFVGSRATSTIIRVRAEVGGAVLVGITEVGVPLQMMPTTLEEVPSRKWERLRITLTQAFKRS